mmetsp:Transcript_69318/g.181639  ORF Transcript_69318/g.181639 Transcript_69318/m.181639 type:complete len:352 (-) Transcript_69318:165-1220(-)
MGISKACLDSCMTPVVVAEKAAYPRSFEEAGAASLANLPQLSEVVGSWRRVKTLGEANFGKVFLVRATPAAPGQELPEVFALKRMPRGRVLAGGDGLESALNEILAGLALKGLSLPHTAQVLFAAQDVDFFYLATEYCEHGELFSVLQTLVTKKQTGMSEGVLREVMQQVLQAVRSLHAAGIAHRDISLENLLITGTGSVRLIDFGQAVIAHPPGEAWKESPVRPCKRGLPGKPCYRAPELMAGVPYLATKVDAFACGVLLYTLAVGAYPSGDLWPIEELHADRCQKLRPYLQEHKLESRVPPGLLDLLEQLLAPRPVKRATVEEAACHPWLVGTLDGLCAPMDVDEENEP